MSEAAISMTIRPDIELANLSDTGCVRQANEDYYVYIEPQDEDEFQKRGRLVLVADGMGGQKGGRVASRIAGDAVRDVFLSTSEDDPLAVLIEGFERAHRGIRNYAAGLDGYENMGTTCTAIVLKGQHVALGHIGDSRLYLIRDGKTQQITRDHTVVRNMVEQGLISEDEAAVHEKRNVLSAALGVGHSMEGDFIQDAVTLKPADILLLCSDGLYGVVSGDEMAPVMEGQGLEEACAELVAWAKVRGGPDNITVQLIRLSS